MATQDYYGENIEPGREGALYDTNEKTLISRTAEETIAFGKPVVQGAEDRGIRLAAAGDTVVLGVSVRERSAIEDEWKQYESVRVMTEGSIWVMTAGAVVAGDPVHVLVATAEFSNAGGVELGARFEESAAAGALVPIRIS